MAIKSITRRVVRTERPTDLSVPLDTSNPLYKGLFKALSFGEGDEPLDLLNHGDTVFTGADHDGNVIGLAGKGVNFTAQRNTGVDSDLYPNQSGDFSAICVVEPSSFSAFNIFFYQGDKIQNGLGVNSNTLETHFYVNETTVSFLAQDGLVYARSNIATNNTINSVIVAGGVRDGRNVTAYSNGLKGPTEDNDAAGIAAVYTRLADCTDTTVLRNFIGKQYLFLSWSRALSDEEMKSLTLNPWQVFEPETETIFFSDVAAVQLIVQSLNHTQNIDNTNLVQSNVLAVSDLLNSQALDAPNLIQANVLTLNELNHSQALDNVTVNQSVNLAVQELVHALSMDNPALVQANVIIVQELLHNHLIDTPALTQANTLAPDPLDHQQLLDNVVLSSAGVLAVDELNHLFSMESPDLTQANVLTVQGSDHSQSLDNIDLLSGVSLIVARLDQTQALDNVSLTQSQFLEIQDAVHAVLFDSPSLNQSNVLSVDELNQSHLIDNVVLTQASTLIVSDILHAHFLDNIDFATGIIRTQNERVFIVKRKERTFIIAKPYRDNLQ